MSRHAQLLGMATLCIALSACGSGSLPSVEPTPSPTLEPTPSPDPTPEPTPDLTAFNDCSEAVDPLIEALRQLDGRLAVGQTFAEYGDRLEEISVEYDRVVATIEDDLDLACLDVAVELEDAVQKYFDAHGIWKDCIDSAACTTDSILTQLQGLWQEATDFIEAAEDALRGMRE